MIKQLFRFAMLLLFIVIIMFISGCDMFKPTRPTPEMIGTWIGLGRVTIPNEYLDQREIPFGIYIDENGTVTGTVGDASIHKTKLQRTSWWYRLFTKSEYKTVFNLYGNIVNRESFRRDGGTLVFNGFEDDELICSFTSTGTHVSSTNLALSVVEIRLRRPN